MYPEVKVVRNIFESTILKMFTDFSQLGLLKKTLLHVD